jgi:putative selenium metabolism protein SsnA
MLIRNASLITWKKPNQILNNHAILIQGGKITDIGLDLELKTAYPHEEEMDAAGQYVMPGIICAHTHSYGIFSRGMAIPGRPPEDFPAGLRKLWWPLDRSMTEEDVRYASLLSIIDAIRHGTTTLFDHHSSPNYLVGSLDVLAETYLETGLRAVLCYETTDRNGRDKAKGAIEENTRFIKRCEKEKVANGRVAATFGLHASFTLSEETLTSCREAVPESVGFHIHVAENEMDEYDSVQKTGNRVVDRLKKHGLLGKHSIVAHAVQIDAKEICLLAETGTWVTHQPRSNMNNGVGVPPVEWMLRAGIKVGMGNDGFSNSMWEEWKTAYLLHKAWNRDPRRMPADQVIEMAVYNNAALTSGFFPGAPIGTIERDALADLIFVDYHPVTPMNESNLPWHILFGFRDSMITTTIVAGEVLMKNRRLVKLDEERIAARGRELTRNLWKRYEIAVPKDQ